jgi:predicted MFS family arabinose efflux permease
MLADLFAPARRATALAVYSSGIYLGYFVAYDFGGWLSERAGWRATLYAVGLPGLVLALVVRFALREPARTLAAPRETATSAVRAVLAQPAFFHVAIGAGIKSIAGYGLATWVPAFLARVHGMGSAEAGAWLGPIFGLGGALGILGGGGLADRLGRRDPRWRMRCAALATIAALPFLYLFLFAESSSAALLAYAPASILGAMYLGPVFALAQDVVTPERRATASAVLLFLINLIGLGLGPPLVGWLNDRLASMYGDGAIRWSLAIVSLCYLWGAAHLLAAARRSGASS